MLRSLRPAGSPEAPVSARACLKLPGRSASPGQSAAWATLAGHTGLGFDTGRRLFLSSPWRGGCSARGRRAGHRCGSQGPACQAAPHSHRPAGWAPPLGRA
eukprot:scaffold131735_cov24-Phaeocystis_antarctica.AAC.2